MMAPRSTVMAASAAVLTLTLAPGLAACGGDDRDMAKPSPSQTTTTSVRGATTSTEGVGTQGAPATFQLTTTAFAPDAVIPDRYTCRGMGAQPDLAWTNVPAGTVELALIVNDPDADGDPDPDGFVHWVMADIDPAITGLAEDEVPAGAVEAENGGGEPGWTGPCPPEGTGVHHYNFELVALGAPLDLDADTEGPDAIEDVHDGDVLGTALLVGTVDAD
jgi:Raf kinase inhibitor-like YbhB/YbcL family protein